MPWRGRSIGKAPSCGETEYDQGGQLLRRPVEAVYEACLYAAAEPGGLFQDFEIRGGLEP